MTLPYATLKSQELEHSSRAGFEICHNQFPNKLKSKFCKGHFLNVILKKEEEKAF